MRVIRLPEVEAKTGLKHSSIYNRIAEGTFPRPVRLGSNSRGFVEAEVDDWIAARIAERDSEAA